VIRQVMSGLATSPPETDGDAEQGASMAKTVITEDTRTAAIGGRVVYQEKLKTVDNGATRVTTRRVTRG
jgi:hypothetical protein